MSTHTSSTIASEYISSVFDPSDLVAVMLLHDGEAPVHHFATAAEVASEAFMESLAVQSDAGFNIYICMNSLSANRRIKANIANVRSVYIDIDQDGDAALAKIAASTVVPTPSYILQSSPGKYQVIWLVQNMSPAEQESLLDLLIHEFGGDPAASDVTRVLRIPGFVNHKYPAKPTVEVVESNFSWSYDRDAFKLTTPVNGNGFKPAYKLPDTIPAGSRNDELFKFAAAMRAKGGEEVEILAAATAVNGRCVPSLPVEEVKTIVRSVMKYPAGTPSNKATIGTATPATIDETGIHLTELGNSDRLIIKYGTELRFCLDSLEWKAWSASEGVWISDPKSVLVSELMKKITREMHEEALRILAGVSVKAEPIKEAKFTAKNELRADSELTPEEAAIVKEYDNGLELLEWSIKSETNQHVVGAVTLARSDPKVHALSTDFDMNRMLFNCANGTLDLSTMEFREHRMSDMCCKKSGTVYDPAATCEMFESWMSTILPDGDDVEYLQKFFGLCLSGLVEQVILILFGSGANGKSVLVSVIESVLGGQSQRSNYNKHVHISTFCQHKTTSAGTPRSDLARLNGSRLITASESSKRVMLDTTMLKELTGAVDTTTARMLYQGEVEFIPTCKVAIHTNHMPQIDDDSLGAWRRLKALEFKHVFAPEEQDTAFNRKLLVESSGILNWLLAGFKAYQSLRAAGKQGLADSANIHRATSEYRDSENSILRFVADRMAINKAGETTSRVLFSTYQSWCGDNNVVAESQRGFTAALLKEYPKLKLDKNRQGERAVKGIVLGSSADESEIPF